MVATAPPNATAKAGALPGVVSATAGSSPIANRDRIAVRQTATAASTRPVTSSRCGSWVGHGTLADREIPTVASVRSGTPEGHVSASSA